MNVYIINRMLLLKCTRADNEFFTKTVLIMFENLFDRRLFLGLANRSVDLFSIVNFRTGRIKTVRCMCQIC